MLFGERSFKRRSGAAAVLAILLAATGCGPDFRQLRFEGQRALMRQDYVQAQDRFEQAARIWPEDPQNLFDLGMVHLALAKQRSVGGTRAGALRELDRAIDYFSRAVEAHPGMQAALAAKNEALEMKGRSEEALGDAEWASAFVGPRAREQIFLAKELEERGDFDGALLRYRQAVAMERDNAAAHAALGRFLMRRGQREMAVRHLKRAYTLNPLEPDVARTLASLHEPLPRTVTPPPSP